MFNILEDRFFNFSFILFLAPFSYSTMWLNNLRILNIETHDYYNPNIMKD